MPTETKKWYTSTTIWANVLVIAIAIMTAVDQQFGTGIMASPITQAVVTVLAAFGIKGRVGATKAIK